MEYSSPDPRGDEGRYGPLSWAGTRRNDSEEGRPTMREGDNRLQQDLSAGLAKKQSHWLDKHRYKHLLLADRLVPAYSYRRRAGRPSLQPWRNSLF
jgi:hypothetical protein